MLNFENEIRRILDKADVRIGGKRPWDLQIRHPGFYRRVLLQGSLGLGESYMDGWWDCEQIDQFFYSILTSKMSAAEMKPVIRWVADLTGRLSNMQTHARSHKCVEKHYDPDGDIILAFLDPYNQYTCGYFDQTDELNVAQEKKLDLICRKLQISTQDHVLDIGCGWGGFARYAAERYGCQVTGVSNSARQLAYARSFCNGLSVEFIEADYRRISGSYDKVLICGMIEHVGYKNYRRLMQIVHRCLAPGGLFLLHTIGGNRSQVTGDPWLLKYFYPNSMLPSLRQLTQAAEGLFVLEDLHNFSAHYDPTFMAWSANFDRRWPSIEKRDNRRFYRMWHYYFRHMAGTFRARLNQLWQLVFSKNGVPGGYASIR